MRGIKPKTAQLFGKMFATDINQTNKQTQINNQI